MVTRTIKQYLVCPYCKSKQDQRASAFFVGSSPVSINIQCIDCDEMFNIATKDGIVKSFSSALSPIDVYEKWETYN
jgi:transcription elongation factor Elf1